MGYTARTSNHGYLPEELLFEILLRLSVDTLLKCKSVCKSWYALISSPNFVKSQYSHESNLQHNILISPELLLDEPFSGYGVPDHLKMSDNFYSDIVGTVNGILCVVGGQASTFWNPATKQFRPLPLLCPMFYSPLLENVQAGFGIDPLSGDYKLVLLHESHNSNTDVLEYPLVSIYYSNNNSWRYLEDLKMIDPGNRIRKSPCNTYLNGVYYWFSHPNETIFYDQDFDFDPDEPPLAENQVLPEIKSAILAFDMSNDKFRVIQVPNPIKSGNLALYDDSLALISHEVRIADNFLNIWVMKNEGNWIKKFTVGSCEDIRDPFGFWENKVLVFATKPLFVTMYNFDTGEFKTVEAGREERYYTSPRIYSYKESVLSIKKEGCECLLGDLCSGWLKDFLRWSVDW